MKKEIIRMLEDADDPENCEYPRDFDRYTVIDSVIDLKYDLERIAGRPFDLENRILDASYFAELEIRDATPTKVLDLGEVTVRVVRLRFSCFGQFFTILEESLTDRLSRSIIRDLIAAAGDHGFVYIDEGVLLEEPYTGCNKELKDLSSWWERYFDYI
jgi:hypothetical protein